MSGSLGGPRPLAELIGASERIVEVRPRDAVVSRHLAAHGRERYLALVEPNHLESVRRGAGQLADRVVALSTAPDVRAVGADVLILHGPAVRHLWVPRDLAFVRRVVIARDGPLEARLARLLQQRTGNLRAGPDAVVEGRRFHVLELPHEPPPRPRGYLSPVTGPAGLFRRLEQEGVSYTVLRWFEQLPDLEPGEDLDVLVADEDLDTFRAVLAEEPGTIPVDAYSETGLPGADYQNIAYYPPLLARRILDRAVPHRSGARVPAPDDYFHALAYHALYHKGMRSGLASTVVAGDDEVPEHDYEGALKDAEVRLEVEALRGGASSRGGHAAAGRAWQDMESLDAQLAERGWRPPFDTLLRLSTDNRWIEQRFFAGSALSGEPPEPAVVVLRQRATEVLSWDEILAELTYVGFEVVAHVELDAATSERCAAELRGGNWGRGPYPVSGGLPAVLVFALHYGPRRPSGATRVRYPHLTNEDLLDLKIRLRDLVNARLEPEANCNPVHSSDNEPEAWEYATIGMPDRVDDLRAEVARRRAEYRTPGVVVAELRRGRRAKVELVEHDGALAVRKTFGHGHLRHLARERTAVDELGPVVAAIPPLLDAGDNFILQPYYRDILQYDVGRPQLVPLRVLREMVATLRQVHEQGFGLVDAKPDNFLLDPDEGLKLIDFEFLHRYPGTPPPFEQSYSLQGAPRAVVGDVPFGPLSYEASWRRWTGLSVEELCNAGMVRQHVSRSRYRLRRMLGRLRRAVIGSPSNVWRTVGRARRRLRRGASQRYRDLARRRARDPAGNPGPTAPGRNPPTGSLSGSSGPGRAGSGASNDRPL